MPLAAQVRLLRVLETGEFTRVGSSRPIKTDVRIIAATNKDLAKAVRAGHFREDLYYRISTVIIEIPPLRERREDIIRCSNISCTGRLSATARRCVGWTKAPASCYSAITGRATCASCATWPSRWPCC